jgi:hypothetical protein
MRELFQSGAIPRPGGGESGGGRGGGGGAGARPRNAQPSSRTIYIVSTNTPPGGDVALQPARIKTGISDGAFTEVTDGLNEGDVIVTGVKQPLIQPAAPGGQSPFGGGGGGFRRGP